MFHYRIMSYVMAASATTFLLIVIGLSGNALALSGSQGLQFDPDTAMKDDGIVSGGRAFKPEVAPYVATSPVGDDETEDTEESAQPSLSSRLYNFLSGVGSEAYYGTVNYGSYLLWGTNPYDEMETQDVSEADLVGVNSLICYMGRAQSVLDSLHAAEELRYLGNRLPASLDSSKTLVRITDTEMARLGLETLRDTQSPKLETATPVEINDSIVDKVGARQTRSWCFAVNDHRMNREELLSLLGQLGRFKKGHGTTWITQNGGHLIHSGTGRVIAYSPSGQSPIDDYQKAAKAVVNMPSVYITEVFLVESRGSVLQVQPKALADYAESGTGDNISIIRQEQLIEQYHSYIYDLMARASSGTGGGATMAAAFAVGGWMLNASIVGSAAAGGGLGLFALPLAAPYLLEESVYDATSAFWLPFVALENISLRSVRGMSSLLRAAADTGSYLSEKVTAKTGYPMFSIASLLTVGAMYKVFPAVNRMTGGFAGGAIKGAGMVFGAGIALVGGSVYLLMSTDKPAASTVGWVIDQMRSQKAG
ncbi:hypothetical protein [Sansalvadorimonas verongulae]|uniref:hypothetical protein n=1 Tax=Sansalvadorimonas verongulae TaxID=2172824 RepID=UPI0012BCF1E6|nr:hypothetical protein [Sansalvadorimonas verongulae]MTI13415.1 hypothetical protein [Sansalvadorimonas verongulae]